MIANGTIIKTDSGTRMQMGDCITAGGQAVIHAAVDMKNKQEVAVKVFHPQFANADTAKRIGALVKQQLNKECSALCAPIERIYNKNIVAHCCPFVHGQSMEEFFANPQTTMQQNLEIAIALTQPIAQLHKRSIAHGDIQAENILIQVNGNTFEIYIIDFDNYNMRDVPLPPMVGHNLYMAPELRTALQRGKQAIPDLHSDLFSLGVVIHELVLAKHVAAGSDADEKQFNKAMCSGNWLHDPAGPDRPAVDPGGYPAEVLNADLARLFRRSHSLDRVERPSAVEWETTLRNALTRIHTCPECGGPCIIDASKTNCPSCGKPYATLKLHTTSGAVINLDSGTVVVGRDNLTGSMKVSQCHAIFRRIGPQTWMEPRGSNGTSRWSGTIWIRLANDKAVLVQKGDRFMFADLEVSLR